MSRNDLVTFKYFTDNPTGHQVCRATVFLHIPDDDFTNEFSVPVNEHFTVFQNTLVFSYVQNDEIPFGIYRQDFPSKRSWKEHRLFWILVAIQFILEVADFHPQQLVLLLGPFQVRVEILDFLVSGNDLGGSPASGPVSGEVFARFLALGSHLFEIFGQSFGVLRLARG